MPHQDREIVIHHETLKQAFDWLLAPAVFAGLKVRRGARWKPRMLAVAALLWATVGESTLKQRFDRARRIVDKVFRWQPPAGATYQGFVKMLRTWHVELKLAILPHIRQRMREVLPGQWEIAGHVVFAADGSRIELARCKSLEDAFSAARKKSKRRASQAGRGRKAGASAGGKIAKKQSAESIAKKENSPQMWLTLLWHVGSGLPWAWSHGPSDSSERGQLEEMLPELPENALITADAGFVGYDFWNTILAGGHDFVIRVGANVRLLKQLGYARQHAHTVYLWPEAAAKKHQQPLVLRLIVIHDGKHPVHLVTNLAKSQLSVQQARTIYAARWGIELYFRTFKQTFGCHKLRSRSAENVPLELDWLLLGLGCICLLGQRELAAHGTNPNRLSAAAAIQAFQGTIRDYRLRPERPADNLWTRLSNAVLDDYQRNRSKMSRNYPRKKQRHAIGGPKITLASKQQIHAAHELKQQHAAFRFTA